MPRFTNNVILSSKRGSRGGTRKNGIFRRHREIIAFFVLTLLCTLLYIQLGLRSGDDEIIITGAGTAEGSTLLTRSSLVPSCPSVLDPSPLKEGLVCIEKCIPSSNNTIDGLGLDPNERVKITMPRDIMKFTNEYGKYRIHFPEEQIYLNLTGRLSNEIKAALEKKAGDRKDGSIVDEGYLQPRSITERLLRRIVAKLLRAGILDPSKSIVNTGSWIGDNALPWALMLESLRPENPGKVIAIDPSKQYVKDMVDLANVNGVGNLCAKIGILSSNNTRVAFIGTSTEHIKVHTEESVNGGSRAKRERFNIRATWTNAITLDSLNLQQQGVSLLHLDVEGHEGELLEGARATIESDRPIIITEGYNLWDPAPEDKNDIHVLKVMTELGYTATSASEISEYVGVHKSARNRIWYPDEKTKDAVMAIVGKDLEHEYVPWIATDLPEK